MCVHFLAFFSPFTFCLLYNRSRLLLGVEGVSGDEEGWRGRGLVCEIVLLAAGGKNTLTDPGFFLKEREIEREREAKPLYVV